jgi:hypothetical protein
MNNTTNNKEDLDDLYYQIWRIISKYKEWVEPSSYLSEKDGYVITKYDDKVSVIFNMTYPYELSFTPIISEGYRYDINVSSNYFNDDINYTQLSTFLHGLIYGLCVVENELPDDVY